MPHIPPPPRTGSLTKSSMPIRVTGETDKITIERPFFFDKNESSAEMTALGFNVKKITTTNRQGPGNAKYKSTARQIVVKIDGKKALTAKIPNGDFSIEIFFDHS